MKKSKLTVLGCGDAFASGGRFCTSFLIDIGNGLALLDCGASTLIRLKQLEISPADIHTVVVTHFHGDHYGGLPFLFLSLRYELDKRNSLTVVGPPGIRDKAYQLQEALYPGTTEVIDDLGVRFVEFGEQWTVLSDFAVQAFPVTHSPPSNPHGVRLRWREHVLAFSGDTEWDDNLIEIARDSEVMICECNFCKEPGPGHLDYLTLSEKAPLLNTRRLLISHMGPAMLASEADFEKLHDGMEIELW